LMKAIRHIGIVVSDLDKALYFYRDLLGLKIVKDMNETGTYIDNISALKGVQVRTVKMAAEDGNLIELLCYSSHPDSPDKKRPINQIGCSHVAFTVENLDEEYNRLAQAGIQFNAPPQHSPDGYAKVTFCMDPDGSHIELVEVLLK
jgi:catechol 2,3-dioxygenase-like lactoylglutathione lyase family enzyme